MPEAIIIAAAAGAAGGVATGTVLGLTGGALATFALINAGISAAVATAQYLLRDKPSEQKNNITQTIRAAVTPVRYILGRCRLAGVLAYVNTRRTNDRVLDMVLLLSEGRCGRIEGIWANGTHVRVNEVSIDNGSYYRYDGVNSNRIVETLTGVGQFVFREAMETVPYYALDLNSHINIDNDFGSHHINEFRLYRNGNVQLTSPRFNSDVQASVTLTDHSGNTLTVDGISSSARFTPSANHAVRVFYEQLEDGESGTIRIELTEGKDFTGKLTVYLYNNPANAVTNGVTLRGAQPDEWTTEHRLNGITWCHVVLTQPEYGDDLDKRFWNNIPEIQILIQGKYITWPNQATPVHTDNAAAIRYWYMRTRMGILASRINLPSVLSAYNKCEEEVTVELSSDYQHFSNNHKRYTIDGLISSGDDVETILGEMDQAWQGNVIYRDGQYYFVVGEEPETFYVIDRDKIIDSVQIQPAPALQDRVNSIGVVLSQGGPVSDWTQLHIPVIDDKDIITRDGQKRHRDLGRRQFISDPIAAGRIMTIALKRARATLRVTYNFMPFTNFILGEYYELTDPVYGFENLKVRCENIILNVDFSITATFSEYIEGTYADTLVLPPLVPRMVQLPIRGKSSISEILNIILTARYEITETGGVLWWIEVSWTRTNNKIQIDILGPNNWRNQQIVDTNYVTIFVPTNGTYILDFIEISNQGRISETTTRTINVQFVAGPLIPVNVIPIHDSDNNSVLVSWDKNPAGEVPTSYDLRYRIVDTNDWIGVLDIRVDFHIIVGIIGTSNYEIQVRAKNSGGMSNWSDSAMTLAIQPSDVRNITSKDITNVSFVVDWDAPLEGTVTGYDVQYKKSDSQLWINAFHSGLETTAIFNGLETGITYNVQIRSKGPGGVGDWITINVTTVDLPAVAPNTPRNLISSAITTTSFLLQWNAPSGGGNINNYDVQYKLSTASVWTDKNHNSLALQSGITNLMENTTYNIRVRSNGPAGTSDWVTLNVTTAMDTDIEYNPPQNVRIGTALFSPTASSFTVFWNAPISGSPTGYDVRYREFGNSIWISALNNGLSAANLHVITNLESDTLYEFGVRAQYAGNNHSEWVDYNGTVRTLVTLMTPHTPATPILVSRTTTSLTVSTVRAVTGGVPDSYRWRYDEDDDDDDAATEVTSTATQITIDNLDENTDYIINVRAENDDGNSPYSSDLSATTLADTPDSPNVPRNLHGDSITQTGFILDWDRPSGGGTINGYEIQYRVNGTLIWLSKSHTGTGTQNTFTGLRHSTIYNVQVRTTGPGGNSSWVSVNITTAAPLPPGVPTNVGVENETLNSFTLDWDAPIGGGALTNYQIQYKLTTSVVWIDYTSLILGTSAVISSLTQNTAYNVRIRSTGLGGTSNWVTVNAMTAAPIPANPPTNLHRNDNPTVSSFVVDWTAPVGGPSIAQYRIEYRIKGTSTYSHTFVNHPTTQVTLTGLEEDTTYEVRVAATASGGQSTWLGPVDMSTAEAMAIPAPSAPGSFAFTKEVGTNFAFDYTFTWTASTGTVTQYEVEIEQGILGVIAWYDAGQTTLLTLTESSIVPILRARVRAVGPGGNGPWTTITVDTI